MTILKALEPYDNNMKVLTKKELGASAGIDQADEWFESYAWNRQTVPCINSQMLWSLEGVCSGYWGLNVLNQSIHVTNKSQKTY